MARLSFSQLRCYSLNSHEVLCGYVMLQRFLRLGVIGLRLRRGIVLELGRARLISAHFRVRVFERPSETFCLNATTQSACEPTLLKDEAKLAR